MTGLRDFPLKDSRQSSKAFGLGLPCGCNQQPWIFLGYPLVKKKKLANSLRTGKSSSLMRKSTISMSHFQ